MLPKIKTRVPGLASKKLLKRLREVECRQITYSDEDLPIFVRSASGVNVTDADGNRFLDLTAFFAVCNLGHNAPAVGKAARRQMRELAHAMGDVHPPVVKVACAERLRSVLPRSLSRTIFSSSGSEAVESALKTAFLATGKKGVIAFEGGYHGLGYGAMQVTHRRYFREPFIRQAKSFASFCGYPLAGVHSAREIRSRLDEVRRAARRARAGAILIEAIQGRGGVREADPRFLRGLKEVARDAGALLICDEVFTGFGRTGRWFAFEHSGVVPDLVTLGKGMSNGFPISACVGTVPAMDAWGDSPGEAKHTSTFLGHPVGCAMTIASIDQIERGGLVARSARLGELLKKELSRLAAAHPKLVLQTRGRGLMIGLEMASGEAAFAAVKESLKEGLILLGSGAAGETLSFTPPFTITEKEIYFSIRTLNRVFARLG